jgi:hypothetical protein
MQDPTAHERKLTGENALQHNLQSIIYLFYFLVQKRGKAAKPHLESTTSVLF